MNDRDGNPIKPGWYLELEKDAREEEGWPLFVFEADGKLWGQNIAGVLRIGESTTPGFKDKLVKITSPHDLSIPTQDMSVVYERQRARKAARVKEAEAKHDG